MKDYFDLKVFVTVLIALILFKILDKMFLDDVVTKMLPKKSESFENIEDEDENENE